MDIIHCYYHYENELLHYENELLHYKYFIMDL